MSTGFADYDGSSRGGRVAAPRDSSGRFLPEGKKPAKRPKPASKATSAATSTKKRKTGGVRVSKDLRALYDGTGGEGKAKKRVAALEKLIERESERCGAYESKADECSAKVDAADKELKQLVALFGRSLYK